MVGRETLWDCGSRQDFLFQIIWFLSSVIGVVTLDDRDELELTPAVTLCLAGLDVTFAAGSSWVLSALLKSRETDGRDIPGTARRRTAQVSLEVGTWSTSDTSAAAGLWPPVSVRLRARARRGPIVIGRGRQSTTVIFLSVSYVTWPTVFLTARVNPEVNVRHLPLISFCNN